MNFLASNILDVKSHRTQLVIAALSASAVTASLFTAYNTYNRRQRRLELHEDVLRSLSKSSDSECKGRVTPPPPPEDIQLNGGSSTSIDFGYDEDLIREQLARNYAFFGEEGMAKIRGASVVVVGCGGVGSWAAVMLVRSGVSKIRLVDFDYVTLSSLNRHATAALSDVGTPKVRCVEKALREFSKWVEIDARIDVWKKEGGSALLEGADWVLDAIDNIGAKVDLLKYCHDNCIKVFSSMGAGAKCDPTRVQISDISYTVYDPLARSVRQRLRLQGVSSGIPVVYSTEPPGDVKLLPLPEKEFRKGNVQELSVLDDFRVRILPVLGPLPSIFGLHAATYILCELAEKPICKPLAVKNRRKLCERIYRDFLVRESKLAGNQINRLPIDEDDVSLIFEDVYQGRSLIPPHDVPAKPSIVRWDPLRPVTVDNCVPMDLRDAEKHTRECSENGRRPEDVWGTETRDSYEKRAKEILRNREWAMQ